MNEMYAKKSGKFSLLMAKRQLAVAVLLLAGSMMSACNDSRPADEIVKERSQERMDALLEGDVEKALMYTTPGYQQLVSVNRYHTKIYGVNRWTKAVVDRVKCEGDVCDVVVMVTYKVAKYKGDMTRRMDEKWIKVDGQWWKYEH